MGRAGVPLLAGTDAIGTRRLPGFSLHDELALLVEAGLTPQQALRAATLGPAQFLGMQDSLGTVAEGKKADLVLLDANPLDDIHNVRKVRGVVVAGRYLPRLELDRMLEKVRNLVESWREHTSAQPADSADEE
jgi:imidazolonepropionase-like amidohydrolase